MEQRRSFSLTRHHLRIEHSLSHPNRAKETTFIVGGCPLFLLLLLLLQL
jgi:hypothetical protein